MSQFSNNWDNKKAPGIGSRIIGRFNNPGPLKPRLDQATRQIQGVMAKLDATIFKLRERDAFLFSRIVSSVQKRDSQRASMFANELAELRKMSKMVTQSKLALEQIVLRLNTVTELGDVVLTLAPATSIVRNLREGLSGVMPEAEGEMSEISGLLSGILVDAGSVSGSSLNFETANEEAERALAEAAAVAETRMQKFPDIPQTVGGSDQEMEMA
ncbi:MAG: Snf7 family protein [Nitrososphaerales archaeon]|jgi:division protein CdvB (Snf7/Vps24/ESCRT-III family)